MPTQKQNDTVNQVDPLSEVTRREKRNLLAVSLFIITLKAFDIHITEIEIDGNKVAFKEEAIPFIAMISGAYFAITFVIYWFIDYKNAETPEHRKNLKNSMRSKVTGWGIGYWKSVATNVCRVFSDDILSVSASASKPLHGIMMMQSPNKDENRTLWEGADTFHVSRRDKEPGNFLAQRSIIKDYLANKFEVYKFAQKFVSSIYWMQMMVFEGLYVFRNIIWDFALPLVIAAYAGLVIAGRADPSWIRSAM